jgi:hypothetical protein
VDASPPAVRIWFDGRIDGVQQGPRRDADKRQVDKGDSRVDPAMEPLADRLPRCRRPISRVLERRGP